MVINATNTTSTDNKDYKGYFETFGAVLKFRYKKLELNNVLMFSERNSSTTRLKNRITLKTFSC